MAQHPGIPSPPMTNSAEHVSLKKAPSRLTILGIIAVIAGVAVLALLYSGNNLIEHLPEALQRLGNPNSQNVTCVVYERPPRTGSSTIAESLRFCLEQKGYDWGHGPWMKYHKVIPFMLDRPSVKKAIVSRHFVLPYWQLRDLLGHCNSMLWISSTRDMRARLFSKAKFDVRGKHGSSTLASDEEEEVLKNLASRESVDAEELYENYPYVDDEKMLRVFPDYIIRAEHLDTDLEELMKALQCWNDVKSRNIHALNSTGEDAMVKNITLKLGDRRHKTMTYLASEVNERGLEMAKEF